MIVGVISVGVMTVRVLSVRVMTLSQLNHETWFNINWYSRKKIKQFKQTWFKPGLNDMKIKVLGSEAHNDVIR